MQGMSKYVYRFGGGLSDGDASMKNLLGGKGANLAEMAKIGLPVPPGFTITTEVCTYYYQHNESYPDGFRQDVMEGIRHIEKIIGKRFGDADNPLLVSVRSGARVSMPGMMDTILNIGLNDETVRGLVRATGDERFAYDSYRRLVQMYGNVVLEVPRERFEEIISEKKKERGVTADTKLSADDWKEIIARYKELIKKSTGRAFPEEPEKQLMGAIGAVFDSWNTRRAKDYRRVNNIPDEWGTAVNVQMMVFGNMGDDCATGVGFTRNPSTGENRIFGEYLKNAQGEDVVAGIRTPQAISIEQKIASGSTLPALEEEFPDIYRELLDVKNILESHYRDVQDFEFTIEKGHLWMLQTRRGKRTALSALKIAVDMAEEGLIDRKTAVLRVQPEQLDQLLHPMIDPSEKVDIIAKGLPASPGAATGKVVFDPDEAEKLAEDGEDVLLVRRETSPDDFHGMVVSKGILTALGGMSSHAAVVARGIGKPCVAGCSAISVDYEKELFTVGDIVVKKFDYVTIDGGTGRVILGKVKTIPAKLSSDFRKFMGWADSFRKMGVRANADTPEDAARAREFGAEGIGLCRTEHMFFEGDRIIAMREMILATSKEERRRALGKVLPYQKQDFVKIFRAMDGLPVIIRTLDPPLHEFLPHNDDEVRELAEKTGIPEEKIKKKLLSMEEANPMLGYRGCRLGIQYPEITEMQAKAIFEATVEVIKEGKKLVPEVMIPLVGFKKELELQRRIVERVAAEVMEETGVKFDYMVGTMIELPRAALTADEIAEVADFFSFGTNDLTQTTLGLSRDDAAKFLPLYLDEKIMMYEPFQVLDQEGVGQLVEMGIERGRKTKPNLEVGICGEHGGEPSSIHFCFKVGMNYVSCSPFRVPIARLAAAHASILAEKSDK